MSRAIHNWLKLFAFIVPLCILTSCQMPPKDESWLIDKEATISLIYSINGGPATTITGNKNKSATLEFKPGDKLKIIALEFPIATNPEFEHVSEQGRKIRLQAQVMRYVPFKVSDQWETPQYGDTVTAKSGTNRIPGNEHEWVLSNETQQMLIPVVGIGEGFSSDNMVQWSHGSLGVDLIPQGKSIGDINRSRNAFAWIITFFISSAWYIKIGVPLVMIGLIVVKAIEQRQKQGGANTPSNRSDDEMMVRADEIERRAVELAQQGHYSEARTLFQQVVPMRTEPKRKADVLVNVMLTYEREGNVAGAIHTCDQILSVPGLQSTMAGTYFHGQMTGYRRRLQNGL